MGAAASAPVAPPEPNATSPAPAAPRPRLTLTGSFSIKSTPIASAPPPRLEAEVKPLTNDDLGRHWHDVAAQLGLEELMAQGAPKVGENGRTIEIDALSVAFHEEFRPHRIDVMQALREKTGMAMLDCKVNPKFITEEELIYSPDNKYKAMLETNPAMLALRRLLPDIDH